jgi:large subunit ribosomal protein L1
MPKKKQTNDPVDQEKNAIDEAEVLSGRADEPSIDEVEKNPDEEAEKALIVEEAADADTQVPAEVAAIHTDNESARELNEKPKKTKSTAAATPKKKRSGKYQKSAALIEKGKLYELKEALELVKKASYSKFDGSVELHLRLLKKKTKGSTESSKGIFNLPHGSGKEKKIIVLDEETIDKIAKTKKIDFDIAIATPELMPKVGKIAKILGPKGKMPDPKSGTVTNDPKAAIAEINSGKVEYRIDSSDNIHQLIGKCSWTAEQLAENAEAVLKSFPKSKITACYVSSTMSPAAAVDLQFLK